MANQKRHSTARATGSLLFTIANGYHISPEDLREAVRLASEMDADTMKAFWEECINWSWGTAGALRRKLNGIRDKLGPQGSITKAKLHGRDTSGRG